MPDQPSHPDSYHFVYEKDAKKLDDLVEKIQQLLEEYGVESADDFHEKYVLGIGQG